MKLNVIYEETQILIFEEMLILTSFPGFCFVSESIAYLWISNVI